MQETFKDILPSDEAMKKAHELKHRYIFLESEIEKVLPHSRERSIAITELQTSCMWAMKAVLNTVEE